VSTSTETASQVGRSVGGDPVNLDLVVYNAYNKSKFFGHDIYAYSDSWCHEVVEKDIFGLSTTFLPLCTCSRANNRFQI
jgi:hypothetical protein